MVPVAFKTVYSFLALLTPPQVLAVPDVAVLCRRAPFPLTASDKEEALRVHNIFRNTSTSPWPGMEIFRLLLWTI